MGIHLLGRRHDKALDTKTPAIEEPVEDVVEDPLLQSTLQTTLADDVNALPDEPEEPDEAAIAKALSEVDTKLTSKWFGKGARKVDVPGAIDLLLGLPDPVMKRVLEALDGRGRLEKVIGEVPKVLAASRPADMLRLYANCPVPVLIARCRDLLSLGLFDWAVRQHEVDAVLDILAALPEQQRQMFLEADNGRFYDVMMQVQASTDAEAEEKKAKEEEAKAAKNPKVEPVTGDKAKASLVTTKDPSEKPPGFFKRVGAGVGVIGDLFKSKADLNKVQTAMGGSVSGVVLDDKAANTVSWADSDWERGLFHAELPDLAIKRMSVADIQTGAVSAQGLVAEAKWRTDVDADTWTHLGLKTLGLGDVNIVVGKNTYTLKSLELQGLKLDGKDAPITQARPMKKGEAIKLIANQLGAALGLNLPAIKGALGGDYSQPETLGSRMADQFGGDMNLNMSVDQIKLGTVSKDGVPMVQDMTLEGVTASVDDSLRSDLLEDELDALKLKPKPTKDDEARIASLTAEITRLQAKEGRLSKLEAKWKTSSLSRKEQDELIALRNELKLGTARMDVQQVHGNGIEMEDGTGVSKLDAKGFSMKATGGAIESARRHQTRGQKLDDLIGKRRPGSEKVPDAPVPDLKMTGGFKELDAKGVTYSHKEKKDTRLSASAKDVGFAKEGDRLDLSAGSYEVDDLAYDPYQTKLDKATGKNLALTSNLKTSAFDMTTTDVGLETLNVGAYKTKVEKGSASSFRFGMGDNGDMSFGGEGIGASGITYDEGGSKHSKVGGLSMGTLDGSMTGKEQEARTHISGTDVSATDVGYVPKDVKVGKIGAKKLDFDMFDEDPCDPAEQSAMKLVTEGVTGSGVTYGKEGTDGFLGVDGVASSKLTLDMPSTGAMGISSPDVALKGIKQGNTKNGKGTSVKEANLAGIRSDIDPSGSTNTTIGSFNASGIDSRSAGLGVKKASGKTLGIGTSDKGTTLSLAELQASGIDERNSGTTVKSASAKGIDVGLPTKGDMTVGVKSGGAKGIKHEQGSAGSLGFSGLSLRKGDKGIKAKVGSVSASDLKHKSGAHADGLTGGGLSFQKTDDGVSAGADELAVQGVDGFGVKAKSLTAKKLSGGQDKNGIRGDLGSLDVVDASYTSEDLNVGMKSGSIKGVKARGIDLSGKVPKGDVDVNEVVANGLSGKKGDHSFGAKRARLGGLFGSSDGSGSVIGGFDDVSLTGGRYDGKDENATVGSFGMQDGRVAMSGVGTDKMGVDGVSVGKTTAEDLSLDMRLGRKLKELFPAPVAEQLGLDDLLGTTMAQDHTRVETPKPLLPTTKTAPKFEYVPGSKLDAGTLAGASGKVELEVPIEIDLSEYYLGKIKADAKLSVTAHDGVIELDDIDLDLDWVATAAKVAGGILNFGLKSQTGLSIGDSGLDIRPGGELAIWFDIDATLFTKRVSIGVFEGGKYGLSDGSGGKGDHISLQKLAESIGSSKPSVRQVSSTEKSSGKPSDVLGDTRAMVDDIADYVDVNNIKLKLSALKLSDGHLGNEDFGLDFVDSDQKGVNQLDASVVAGGQSHVEAKDLRARKLRVATGGKDVGVDKVDVKGTELDVSNPLGSLKGEGTAKAKVESATLEGTTYGSDLSKDPRFAGRKKK
jgi:hypothetical protein